MAPANSSLVYTRYPSPGVALIIVNENFQHWEERRAACKDFQELTDTFRRLGFKIVALYNVTNDEILAVTRRGNAKPKGCTN